MGVNILKEDRAATAPGSSTQSYINQNLAIKQNMQANKMKWIALLEFSCPNRSPFGDVNTLLRSVINELTANFEQYGEITFQVYDSICSIRS